MSKGIKQNNQHIHDDINPGQPQGFMNESGQELRENEERFRTLVEDAPFGLSIMRQDGTFEYLNPRFTEIFGYTREDIPNKRIWFSKAYPDKRYRRQVVGIWKDDLATGIANGQIHDRSFSVRCKDGNDKIIHFRAVGLKDGKQILTYEDITERRKNEEELRYRYELEKLITTISSDFIILSYEEIDRGISIALKIIGEFARVDRSYVILLSEDGMRMTNTHEWCAKGVKSLRHKIKDVPLGDFHWVSKKITDCEVIHIPRVTDLPEVAQAEKRQLQAYGVQSVVAVPLFFAGRCMGAVGFDSIRQEKEWSDETISLLKLIGGVISNVLERKRSEEEIRKFKTISDKANYGNAIMDIEGNIIYANECFARMHGYSPEDILGRPLSILHAKEQMGHRTGLNIEIMYSGGYTGQEVWHTRKDGSTFPVIINAGMIKDDAGTPLFFSATVIDISERKQAEEALQLSEEKYRELVENINNVIYTVDKDGRLTYISPAVTPLMGYTPPEMLGRPFSEFIHPKDLPHCLRNFRLSLTDRSVFGEYRVFTQSGKIRWINTSTRPIAKDGQVIGVQGVYTDITERKTAEKQLRDREEKYRNVVENSNECICILQDNAIKFINHQSHNLLGAQADDLTGTPFTDYVHPGELEKIRALYLSFMAGKEDEQRFETILMHGDGQARDVEINVSVTSYDERRAGLVFIRDITERKKAENALRDSEAKFKALAEHSPNMIFINKQGRIVYANKKCEEIMGYKREEFYAAAFDFYRLIAPEHRDTLKANFKHHMNEEDVPPVEYGIITKKGKRIDAILTTKLIDYEKGRAILGIVTDISRLKEAEEALRDSEAKYRLLVETQTDLVVKLDCKGRFLFVSPSYCELFGKSEKELFGKQFLPMIHKQDQAITLRAMEKLHQPPHICSLEHRGTTPGGWRWIAWAFKSVLDEHGTVIGIVGAGRDITERKQAEEDLSLSKTRQEYLLWANPAIIYTTKASDGYAPTYVSENIFRQLGYTPKEFLFDPQFRFNHIHPEDLSMFMGNLEELLEKEIIVQNYRFLHKDGTYRWLNDDCRLIRDEKGKPLEIVGSIIDITEQKCLEEQFHHAQRLDAVGRLAGGVAHDFNNLLQTIMGYCDFMLFGSEDTRQIHKDVEEIKKATVKAASLTRQLLAFSRKQSIEPSLLNLNSVINDLTKMLKRLIGEDIEFSTIMSSDLMNIKADQGNIEQIIMNLVVNARDAMPQGGRLCVKTENIMLEKRDCRDDPLARPGRFVCLSVEDTGTGIDSKVKAHIFEPFFSTKKKGEGTGLGLSTVYGIVKQHEGWIQVITEPGQGTTFRIFLPAIIERIDKTSGDDVDMEKYHGNGERILIVEDEIGVREMAKRALDNAGYAVYEASCVQEALNILQTEKGHFDLVLSDVVLPDQSGILLAEQIQSSNEGVKIILCSGYTDQRSQLQIIHSKGITFLQKPYSLTDLLKAIKSALKSCCMRQKTRVSA
ncbi:MAG: PAS domain S-box protein [bacterium]